MKIAEAFVEVRPDTAGFKPALDKDVVAPTKKAASDIARDLAGAFTGRAFVGFLGSAKDAASDLAESTSKSAVVFGEADASVQKFAKNAATSLGQSQAQALEATGTFGNLLRSVGLSEKESAKFSTTMVQLASDLASFNNTSPEEALEALRSGLVGETEPLKRFGVNLNEATLKQKALQLGLSDGKSVLDSNAKAQAAYALIMEQTSLAQGDFARTADGAANKQRIVAAQLEDTKAKIGAGLLPAYSTALSAVSALTTAFGALPGPVQTSTILLAGTGTTALLLAPRIRDAVDAITSIPSAIRTANTSLKDFASNATGIKGALGKAGLAGAAVVAAVAVDQLVTGFRTNQLRQVSGDIDEVTASLSKLGKSGGSAEFDLKSLGEAFENVNKSLGDDDSFGDKVINFFGQGGNAAREFRAQTKAAEKDIDAVDKALTELFKAGDRAGARNAFQEITDSLKTQGISTDEITRRFDDYAGAVKDAGGQATVAANATDELGNAAGDAGPKIKTAADIVDEFNDALDKYFGKALDAGEANDRVAQGFLDLADAVKAVKDQKGIQTAADFNANTEAAIAYRDQIRSLLGYYADLIKTTGATKAEANLLADAFYDQAIGIEVPKEEALKYTAVLKGIPADAETVIKQQGMAKSLTDSSELAKRLGDIDGKQVRARADVDTGTALQRLAEVRRALDSIANASAVANVFVGSGERRAAGGPLNDGLTLVGEQGPEIAEKHGSQVRIHSNQHSRRMVGGGGGVTVIVQGLVVGTERELASQLARLLESLD